MKKKTQLEADMDPVGTRHTRPGFKAAESAIANSRTAAKPKRPGASSPTRPGATAATRSVAAKKRKRPSGR